MKSGAWGGGERGRGVLRMGVMRERMRGRERCILESGLGWDGWDGMLWVEEVKGVRE